MLRGLRCVGAARQAGARLRAPRASCRGLAMAANTLEEFPTPAPAAIASGSIISGDIINFNPQGDATDPTGCYRLNNAFADAVERHGMTAVHQANVVFDDYNQRDTRPGFTSVVLIDASHCTAHCYGDTQQLSIDVFTCGSTNPKLIYDDAIAAIMEMSPGATVTSSNTAARFISDAPAAKPAAGGEAAAPDGEVKAFMKRNYKHFNAATTVEAAEGWNEVLDAGGKMFVTLAGAMSTAELGISLAEMIRAGKVHAICCTGANLEEDFFNLIANKSYFRIPDWRNLSKQQETELYDKGYNRVTDTCIPEAEAVRRMEVELNDLYAELVAGDRRVFPYELFYELIRSGKCQRSYEIDQKDSWLIAAAEANLPIWTPGWEDSTCANMLVAAHMKGELASMPVKSGCEQMAELCRWYQTVHEEGVGFFQIGGGIAGDFPICAVPLLRQDMEIDVRPWQYFCQISEAATSYGGYSGAPPAEKITWGKITETTPSFVIESDATIVFPLIASYVLNK